MNKITAKLNKGGDKAYINIEQLLAAVYGDDFVKEDTGKTFKGYKVYDYAVTRPIQTAFGAYPAGADTSDIRSLKRDSYIFFLVSGGKADTVRGAIASFPNAKKAAAGIVDDITEWLANADIEVVQ